MKEFKDIFFNLRTENGYTQSEIAKLLHTSRATVSMWEMGERNPKIDKMEEIGDFFNVDMDYLYGKTDIKRKVSYDERGNEVLFSAFEKTALTYGMLTEDEIKVLNAYRDATDQQKVLIMNLIESWGL